MENIDTTQTANIENTSRKEEREEEIKFKLRLPTKEEYSKDIIQATYYYKEMIEETKKENKRAIEKAKQELRKTREQAKQDLINERQKLMIYKARVKDIDKAYEIRIKELRNQNKKDFIILENKDSEKIN